MALMECVRGERPGVFNNRLFHRAFERLVSSSLFLPGFQPPPKGAPFINTKRTDAFERLLSSSAARPGLSAPSAPPCSVGKQAHVSFCAGHCSWGRACQP